MRLNTFFTNTLESLAHVSLYLGYFTQASTTFSRALCFNTAISSLTPSDPSVLPWVLRKWGFVCICPNMTKKQQRIAHFHPPTARTSDPNNLRYVLGVLLTVHIPGKDKLVGFYLRDSLKRTHTNKQKNINAVFKKLTYTFTGWKITKIK